MSSKVKWRDLVYCSNGKLAINPDGRLAIDTAHIDDPIVFIGDLLKSALEAQIRNNALVPVDQYSTTFSSVTNAAAYYDSDSDRNLDVVQLSIQVAQDKDGVIIKGL